MNNRIKQTARKTTGGVSPQEFIQQGNSLMSTLLNHESGKPPSSKKGFFNSPSGDSAAQQHSDSHDPVQKRRSEHNPTFPDEQTHSPTQSRKPMSRGNEKRGKDPDQTNRHAAGHIRNEFMWTAPTSNIRGDNEEEEDELLSFSLSPASHSPRNTEKSPVAKTKTNAITKCDRCRTNGTNPICIPYPGSKKCAKCVRDHRTCSWTSGLSGPSSSSSFGGKPSLKTGHEKTSSEKPRKEHESVSVKSKIDDPSGQIGPKCKRCASNATNPICERSNDPNDAKCKKCRRDKQSCSFAPFSKPFANRKKIVSAGAAAKGDTDEEDGDGGEDEEQNGSVETGLKEKKKGEDAEKKMELDSEESQTEAAGDGNRGKSPKAPPKKVRALNTVGETSSLKTKTSMLPTTAENQREGSKRKKEDDSPSEGDRSSSKKKKRPNTISLDHTTPSASTSNANGSLQATNSNSHHDPHGTSGLPGLHLNETGNTSTPSSTTTPRVITIPSAIQGQINGRTRPSQHSASVGSSIVTQHTGQRPETVVQDRSIAVIERELRAAEVKAASHRSIAESYLRDADRAEEEVLKLKKELLTAVRNNTSLGVEGVAAERKLLIEQLLGSGGDQRA